VCEDRKYTTGDGAAASRARIGYVAR